MEESTKIPEKKAKNKNASAKASLIQSIISGKVLDGDMLRKYRAYMVMLFCLALAYIGYHYWVEQTVATRQKLEYEVRLRQVEYSRRLNELTERNKRSEIQKEIQRRNLPISESQTPPKRINAD